MLPFRPRVEQKLPGAGKPTISRDPAMSPDPATQELLGSLSAMFRAAGCPGLAESFRVEAGGRCG